MQVGDVDGWWSWANNDGNLMFAGQEMDGPLVA